MSTYERIHFSQAGLYYKKFKQFCLAYYLLKSDAECDPPQDIQAQDAVDEDECAKEADKMGAKMFLGCRTGSFVCYVYSKSGAHGNCGTKHNPNGCNLYGLTGKHC